MTEENLAFAPAAEVSVQAPIESAAPVEKMLPQSHVDQIVKKAKHDEAEKVRREYSSQQSQSQQSYQAPQSTSHSQMGGMNQDQLRSMIADETKRQQQEILNQVQSDSQRQEGERIANKFISQMQEGGSEFDDFADAISDLPFEKMPQVVHAATELDNTAAVMRHLALNPMKLTGVMTLAEKGMNRQVAKMMQDISASIKSNDQARSISAPNDPLSQIKSSPNSTDSGARTVSDFRKMLRKR